MGLRRGELDELMQEIDWTSLRLDGHQLPGKAGRSGPHAKCRVYRGLLPSDDDDNA